MARENLWLMARRGAGTGLEQRENAGPGRWTIKLFSAAVVEATEPVGGRETSGHPRGQPCRGHRRGLLEGRPDTVHTDALRFF